MSTRIALAAFRVSLYYRWAVQTAKYLSFVRLKPSPLLHLHKRLIGEGYLGLPTTVLGRPQTPIPNPKPKPHPHPIPYH